MAKYFEVLSAAVNDIVEKGYDSADRVRGWAERIVEATRGQFGPLAGAEDKIRESLRAAYRRLVDNEGILSAHRGLPKGRINRIKWDLRSILERRILAAVQLVRFNRDEAVSEVAHRFTSWATSVPPGGTADVDKPEVKGRIKKSLIGLAQSDASLAADQKAKLEATLSSFVAEDNGALAGEWHSRWQEPGYDYREDHKERDLEFYLVRDSWAWKAGFLKKAGTSFTDEIEMVGEWPHCRCRYRWFYDFRDLPERFLTARGKAYLASL